jgi:diguanylate cyclase (GGDEF)-like protein
VGATTSRVEIRRSAALAGRLLLLLALLVGAWASAQTPTVDGLLQRADKIKLDHNNEFQTLLKQLDSQSSQLTAIQRDWLAYLHAWQLGYLGEYPQAMAAFGKLLSRPLDPTLSARARISLIYDQVNASHIDDAYSTLGDLLEFLPRIQDRNARFLTLDTAAYLYREAGQYDMALGFLDQAAAIDQSPASVCIIASDRMDILSKAGLLKFDDSRIQPALDSCTRIGASNDASSIILKLAIALLDADRTTDALKLLRKHDAEVVASHSAALTSDFRATLARCELRLGNLAQAAEAAQSAIAYANQQPFAKSVTDSYDVLYQVAKRQGDDKAALAWHEKYSISDKGYLNDVSTRALAYQKVHQRVLDNERQLAAEKDRNQVLALQQKVSAQQATTRLLAVLLLICVLLIVVGWAYRTKRSQIKFQKLARRDGLTGIFNRQHFFDVAQEVLRYAARGKREACVLAMDLDHFKSVNDMHGHAAGDDALRRVVAVCEVLLRSIDVFGRLGGEEFAILLPDCPLAVARQRAEQMREAIAASRREGDAAADVLVTASFGIAATQDCGYNLTTLLAAADDALYAAKRAGRNRVEIQTSPAATASA